MSHCEKKRTWDVPPIQLIEIIIGTHVLTNLDIMRFLWNFHIQNGKGENNHNLLETYQYK
jgi:hypothetical protein